MISFEQSMKNCITSLEIEANKAKRTNK